MAFAGDLIFQTSEASNEALHLKREGREVACILIVDLAADLLEVSALLPRRLGADGKRIEIRCLRSLLGARVSCQNALPGLMCWPLGSIGVVLKPMSSSETPWPLQLRWPLHPWSPCCAGGGQAKAKAHVDPMTRWHPPGDSAYPQPSTRSSVILLHTVRGRCSEWLSLGRCLSEAVQDAGRSLPSVAWSTREKQEAAATVHAKLPLGRPL